MRVKTAAYLLIVLSAFGGGWYVSRLYDKPRADARPGSVQKLKDEDPARARESYARAAAEGDAEAAYMLGELYLTAHGGEADVASAVAYLRMAALKDHARAQEELTRFYEEGLAGLPKNAGEALVWRMVAARGGAAEDMRLKESFVRDPVLYRRALDAFALYQKARVGGAEDAFEMGRLYEEGDFLEKDLEEAAKWYTQAAARKIPAAQARLGLMYAEGRGVPKDEVRAYALLSPAAEAGDPLAQLFWGRRAYTQGEEAGGPDYAEAFKWFMSAAAQGNTEAQYLTGVMYMQGQGTEKSVKNALQAFSRAAESGHPNAQYVVGQSYYKGLGIRKNLSEARKWLGKAAANGNAAAQTLLDEMK